MSEKQIREDYLAIWVKAPEKSEAITQLKELLVGAKEAGLRDWCDLIQARISQLRGRKGEALKLVQRVLRRTPDNRFALLIKAFVAKTSRTRRNAGEKLLELTKRSRRTYDRIVWAVGTRQIVLWGGGLGYCSGNVRIHHRASQAGAFAARSY